MNAVAKRTITALLTATLVVLAVVYSPVVAIMPAICVLAGLAMFEFYQLTVRKWSPIRFPGLMVLIIGAAFIGLEFFTLGYIAVNFKRLMLLYMIALVKISDMGGFAFGLAFGKHKMCPSISPKKSWEGLAGSVFASCILSLGFMSVSGFSIPKALAFGVVAAVIGTMGDLIESKFKRTIGVKDSSTFMPAGMGGFLDMFDSLLLAPSVLVLFI